MCQPNSTNAKPHLQESHADSGNLTAEETSGPGSPKVSDAAESRLR